MWLTNFKIAIVQKNADEIGRLVKEMPKFETLEENEEALYLIKEAALYIDSLRNEAKSSMVQLKKNLEFVKSTRPHSKKNTLNIKL